MLNDEIKKKIKLTWIITCGFFQIEKKGQT
jgi:hypothetical protein